MHPPAELASALEELQVHAWGVLQEAEGGVQPAHSTADDNHGVVL